MQIEVQKITKSYGKKRVLNGISFSAEGGQCIGILGGNGSGKSTLLSILTGIQPCDGGRFLCDGHDVLASAARRSELLGYVPQGTPLIEELTARDNLRLWYDRATLKRELENGVLATLGVSEFLKTPVYKLSGGMKKRLSIGCAVAKHPPVILLDEPMAALDWACKQSITAYLRRHKENGGILLLVTHDAYDLALCDEWYILKDGVAVPFVYDGNVDRLVRRL